MMDINNYKGSFFGQLYTSFILSKDELTKLRGIVYADIKRYDTFTDWEKSETLRSIIDNLVRFKEILAKIENSLHSVINGSEEVRKNTPSKFHYSYAIANFRIAYRQVIKARELIDIFSFQLSRILRQEKVLEKKRFSVKSLFFIASIRRHLYLAGISLQQYQKINELKSIFNHKLSFYLIPKGMLKKGDILLSYKTDEFLKQHLLSKLISISESSKITHASIVYENKKESIQTISATADTERVSIIGLEMKRGEIEFVLRPRLTGKQKLRLDSILGYWYKKISSDENSYTFSELKCWIAAIVGLVYITTVRLTGRNILIPNLIRRKNSFFCSELIDYIFKQDGIMLSARSQYDSIVGPAEFFYSPYLDFIGVVCNKEDEKYLDSENLII